MTLPLGLVNLTAWPKDPKKRPRRVMALPKAHIVGAEMEIVGIPRAAEQAASRALTILERTLAVRSERAGKASIVRAVGDHRGHAISAPPRSQHETSAEHEVRLLRHELHEQRMYFEDRIRRLECLIEEKLQQLSSSAPDVRQLPAPDEKWPLDQNPSYLVDLSARYELPEQQHVLAHLAARPALPAVLIAAADELKRRFEATRLALLARDDDRFVITVETSLDVEEAEGRLIRFRREWWQPKIDVEDRTIVKLRYV